MKEIKFRAFNGDRIVKVNAIGWTDGEIDWVDTSKNDDFNEGLILMQYTGLKDRNGVEIYEGDIIRGMDMLSARTGFRVDDREVVGQVVIDSSSVWGFSIVEYETEYHLNDFLENDQEAEVIGNIYQNKDLLEG